VSLAAARAVGWVAMISGWFGLLAFGLRRWGPPRTRGLATGICALSAGIYLLFGAAHLIATGGSYQSDLAIALPNKIDVREGPGDHRKVVFSLQGGARVRLLER